MQFTYKQTVRHYKFKIADSGNKSIQSPQIAHDLLKEDFNPLQESMHILLLNTKNKVIDKIQIAQGCHNSLIITPKEILIHPLQNGCPHIILAHSHPSGDVTPSEEDIAFTRKIKKACDIMGISLLDHIIYSADGMYSFKQNDLV